MFSKMECLHLEEADLSRKCAMASSSTFPSSHQNTSVSGVFLSRLCTPFCFGYTDCCQHPGMQCWPLAWLIARPCFVLLLQVCCRGRTISRHSWFWGPEACNYWRLTGWQAETPCSWLRISVSRDHWWAVQAPSPTDWSPVACSWYRGR